MAACQSDLFPEAQDGRHEPLGRQACVLRGFALTATVPLLATLHEILQAAPPLRRVTPGGLTMSVASTNCGRLGWITDRRGYRYTGIDPANGCAWPAMPPAWREMAHEAAHTAGFAHFEPDACLINRYEPGARLSLHQDRDEADFSAPIVSVSLGMAATFLFGGLTRSQPVTRTELQHGDVVVWGGGDRLRFHGVLPLRGDPHPMLGHQRFNLTFRKAG